MGESAGSGILVANVDDDPLIRTALARLTRSLGYEPVLFERAELLLVEPTPADIGVVVTDIQMPGMTGLDLLRILRVRFPDLPVIIMTAYPSEVSRERASALGAFAYLTKPFDAREYESCLSDAFGRTRNT